MSACVSLERLTYGGREEVMSDSQLLHKATRVRAGRTLGQLWQVPTFLAGVLAVAVVAVSAPLRQDPAAREFDHALQRLRAVLNAKEGRAASSFLPLADDVLGRAALYPHKAA